MLVSGRVIDEPNETGKLLRDESQYEISGMYLDAPWFALQHVGGARSTLSCKYNMNIDVYIYKYIYLLAYIYLDILYIYTYVYVYILHR